MGVRSDVASSRTRGSTTLRARPRWILSSEGLQDMTVGHTSSEAIEGSSR
jgi:hypothetical protein